METPLIPHCSATWALVGLIWTVQVVQVPPHKKLERGFDDEVWRKLVITNWWRTAAWTLRGVLVAAVLLR